MSAPAQDVELLIGGMTCASCAARVEKKLNRLDGVTATVNYATEKAKVSFGEGVTTDDLIATVEKTGYTAALPRPRPEARSEPARRGGKGGPLSGDGGPCGGLGLRPAVAGESGGDLVEDGAVEGQ
jgi:copper chaperone CopZ